MTQKKEHDTSQKDHACTKCTCKNSKESYSISQSCKCGACSVSVDLAVSKHCCSKHSGSKKYSTKKDSTVKETTKHECSKCAKSKVPEKRTKSSKSASSSAAKPPSSWYDFGDQAYIHQYFLEEVNAIRISRSLHPLKLHPLLNKCAARHNYDQAFNLHECSHRGSDGSKLHHRLKRVRYDFAWGAENVAHRQETPSWALNSFMKSAGHRKNIVSRNAKEMGIHGGIGLDGYWYWTMVLGLQKH